MRDLAAAIAEEPVGLMVASAPAADVKASRAPVLDAIATRTLVNAGSVVRAAR